MSETRPGNGDDLDAAHAEALWARVYDPLVRFAWLLVGSRDVAEDLVSAAFLRSYGRLKDLQDPEPYLRRAVLNGCRSLWRSEDARRRATAKLTVRTQSDERVVELVDVLQSLPLRQRAAVVLRYLYDFDDTAIAAILGCRPATVRSNARHGLARLKEALHE